MMTLAQFVELLDIHGADPARWPDPSREAAQELLAANADARAVLAGAADFDVLIARHYRRASPHAGARSEEQAMVRVLARLEAPLPPQRRGLLPRLLPAALLEFDLAPAWPRFAALVGIAVLGFAVGLSDAGMAVTKKSASAIVGIPASSDSDLSLILFEPDPLSAMR
ncbi:MAG: hypothetical protein E6G84_00520 [Alphaproteobacteria bacterium]|nr:MAG: hypothetical protein E6G84_00520 [Alphaproteobacteria bacterium]